MLEMAYKNKRQKNFRNESGKTKEIYINGAIITEKQRETEDEVSAYSFNEEVKHLKEGQDMIININSPGGALFEAVSIANQIKGLDNNVTVNINSLCASAATIIALSANQINMRDNASYMIHNVNTIAIGDARELRKAADDADEINETLIKTYTKATNLTRAKIVKMMNDETWMGADEAKKYGFVHEIIEGKSFNPAVASGNAAAFAAHFKSAPKKIKANNNRKLYL